jgi:hypothetical protein
MLVKPTSSVYPDDATLNGWMAVPFWVIEPENVLVTIAGVGVVGREELLDEPPQALAARARAVSVGNRNRMRFSEWCIVVPSVERSLDRRSSSKSHAAPSTFIIAPTRRELLEIRAMS